MTDAVLNATPTAPAEPVVTNTPQAPVDPSATLYPNTQHAEPPAQPNGEPNPPKAAEPAKADGTEEGKDGKANEPKPGAPEKYEDFKLPEGFEVDPKAMEQFTPIAKELNLTQDQAQKLVNLQSELVKEAAQRQVDDWNKLTETWHTTAQDDKEYGGLKFDENVGLANAALAKFGTPELIKTLSDFGMANHPEMVRVFYRVGKAMAEDTIKTGAASTGPKDPANVLFPNMK